MKRYLQFLVFCIVVFNLISCEPDDQNQTTNYNVSMGVKYANDIYFSLSKGVVSTPSRTEWDLAFYTNARTSSILINGGKGLLLYPWKSIAEWESADTTGLYLHPVYSNIYTGDSWQNGAFDQGALGHPDYGWGVYDMTSHNVVGDSVYILKKDDGSVKKVWIEKRESTNNTFYFRYANLDGSDLKIDSIACNDYLDKNMIYYSIDNQLKVDHEPATANWDIVFTKYYLNTMNYNITGVLSNNGVQVAKVTDVDVNTNKYTDATFSSAISAIGWEWKQRNPDNTYFIPEKEIYFIKDQQGKAYKIVFKTFEGQNTGNLSFELTSY